MLIVKRHNVTVTKSEIKPIWENLMSKRFNFIVSYKSMKIVRIEIGQIV